MEWLTIEVMLIVIIVVQHLVIVVLAWKAHGTVPPAFVEMLLVMVKPIVEATKTKADDKLLAWLEQSGKPSITLPPTSGETSSTL